MYYNVKHNLKKIRAEKQQKIYTTCNGKTNTTITSKIFSLSHAPFHYPRQSLGNFQVVCNNGFAVKIRGNFETTKVYSESELTGYKLYASDF